MVQNGDETDVDCGGSCGVCADGAMCAVGSDCSSQVCGADMMCAVPSCDDMVQNGDETDIDCAGSCGACDDGEMCAADSDCNSQVCGADMMCAVPSCVDEIQNGDELGQDCGGACDECIISGTTVGYDNMTRISGWSIPGGGLTWMSVGQEEVLTHIGIDLAVPAEIPGNAFLNAIVNCSVYSHAAAGTNEFGANDVRLADTVVDFQVSTDGGRHFIPLQSPLTIQAGEYGLGCYWERPEVGAVGTVFPLKYENDNSLRKCFINDAQSLPISTNSWNGSNCAAGQGLGIFGLIADDGQPACDDGVQNGDESDVDCGGSCGACDDGEMCAADSDCSSQVCGADMMCAVPSCDDGVQNGDELGQDCGGACAACIISGTTVGYDNLTRISGWSIPGGGLTWMSVGQEEVLTHIGIDLATQAESPHNAFINAIVNCSVYAHAEAGTTRFGANDVRLADTVVDFQVSTDGGRHFIPLQSPLTIQAGEYGLGCYWERPEVGAVGTVFPLKYENDASMRKCLITTAQILPLSTNDWIASSCGAGQGLGIFGLIADDGQPACDDGVQNGDESDVDCGGSCGACDDGEMCAADSDCSSQVCGADMMCAVPSCDDGVQNGDELGQDCGGACAACIISGTTVGYDNLTRISGWSIPGGGLTWMSVGQEEVLTHIGIDLATQAESPHNAFINAIVNCSVYAHAEAGTTRFGANDVRLADTVVDFQVSTDGGRHFIPLQSPLTIQAGEYGLGCYWARPEIGAVGTVFPLKYENDASMRKCLITTAQSLPLSTNVWNTSSCGAGQGLGIFGLIAD